MFIKPVRRFENYGVKDFGLKATDKDTHLPAFYVVLKSRNMAHDAKRKRSVEGKQIDRTRRYEKKRAAAAAEAASARRQRAEGQEERPPISMAQEKALPYIDLSAQHSTLPLGRM